MWWHKYKFNFTVKDIKGIKANALKINKLPQNRVRAYPSMQQKTWGILIAAVVIFFVIVYGWTTSRPVSSTAGNDITIVIKNGMNTNDISELLYYQGLIKSKLTFNLLARFEGMQNSLKAGDYVLQKNMTIKEIIQVLSKGKTTYADFTVPEGFTVDQIAKLLEEKKLANSEKFKKIAQSDIPYDYINPQKNVKYKVEGFLFPDTYKVPKSIDEEALVKMMASQFNDKFTPDMRERAKALDLSLRDVVTLASLVEKEAQKENERAIIAAVFLNRLKKDMPLQSCATIQYILGYPKPELSIQDTEIPSPYNTYQNMGLPPGPIANPGLASINAVLYPAATEYLFFVADKHGVHHFSNTYEEHLMAISQVGN